MGINSQRYCTLRLISWTWLLESSMHESGRDPARIHQDCDGIAKKGHESHSCENDGVQDAGGRHETEPTVDEDKDRGEVNIYYG
ncbi:hypothetical protein NC652_036760 [Populus alba x Populus x berolinensis]|nr:hypothetical protein NC652_036760 [Populus alba x Populus x berolinensis]